MQSFAASIASPAVAIAVSDWRLPAFNEAFWPSAREYGSQLDGLSRCVVHLPRGFRSIAADISAFPANFPYLTGSSDWLTCSRDALFLSRG
jgi:hypothetical protein